MPGLKKVIFLHIKFKLATYCTANRPTGCLTMYITPLVIDKGREKDPGFNPYVASSKNRRTAGSELGKLLLLRSTEYISTVAHFCQQLSCFHLG